MRVYLYELTVYDPSIEATRVLRMSTGNGYNTQPADTPSNTNYAPRVLKPLSVRRSMFSGGATQGQSVMGLGDLELSNPDGVLDGWLAYAFDGREIRALRGDDAAAYSTFEEYFVGTMEQLLVTQTSAVVKVRDRQAELDRPLQATKYAGDNVLPDGLEGTAELAGKPKPICYGVALNVPATCVNPSKQIYQVNDGAIDSIDSVYDRGIELAVLPYISQPWTSQTHPFGSYIVYGIGIDDNGNLLAVGGNAWAAYSTDRGVTWASRSAYEALGTPPPSGLNLRCVVWATDRWVAGSEDGGLVWSADGNKWFPADVNPLAAGDHVYRIAYNGTTLVAVCAGGKLVTSSNKGVSWTSRTSTFGSDAIWDVTYGGGKWVIVGGAGKVASSTDATTWTSRTSNITASLRIGAVEHDGSIFLLAAPDGATSEVSTSSDGITWTKVFTGSLGADVFDASTLIYAEEQFIFFGEDTSSKFSTDGGVTWTSRSLGISVYAQSALYDQNSGTIVVVGFGPPNIIATCHVGARTAYASLADLEDDALEPPPFAVGVYLAGGYFRLGTAPDGLITADVVQGASAADRTAAQIFAQLVEDRGGIDSGDISSADLTALDSDNSAEIGFWTADEMTVAQACDAIATSPGAWWGVDQTGDFRIQRLEDPASETPLRTFPRPGHKVPLERRRTTDDGRGVPVFRSVMRYGRLYAVQNSDIAGGVSAERRAELAKEWREAIATDSDVQTQHLLARQVVRETLFAYESDAQAEATRDLALRSPRHDRFGFGVQLEGNEDIDLGTVIAASDCSLPDVLAHIRADNPLTLEQIVHTRASTAYYLDETGVYRQAAVDVLRAGHFLGGKRKILLEQAATNRVQDNPSAWTLVAGCTRTTGVADAFGGTDAVTLTDADGAQEGYAHTAALFTGLTTGTNAISLCVKKGTSTSSVLILFDSTAGADRHRVTMTWTAAGVPSFATAIGGGTFYVSKQLVNGWWRISFTANSCVAGNSHRIFVVPAGPGAAATGTLHISHPQVENGAVATSPIAVNSTRAVDIAYTTATVPLAAFTIYARFTELGTSKLTARVLQIGNAANGDARAVLSSNSSGFYTITHDVGATTVNSSVATTPAVMDTVELRAVIKGDGKVSLGQSVNGGAEVVAAESGAAAFAAWATPTRLYLNSIDTSLPGVIAFDEIIIAGGGISLAELRAPTFNSRFGLAVPKNFVVIGVEADELDDTLKLDVWG